MQYGPGAENAFAGVATAFSDSSPVVFLPLGHPRETAQLSPMFKSSRTYASITKSVEEIILPQEVANVMRRAFAQVKNGRQGPVMVEVPADVHSIEVGVDPNEYRPVPVTRSAGDERDIDEAAHLLLDASCPMILAGQGVFYAEACDELKQLAELLQTPVMTTFDGKSAFPEDHALALGPGGGTLHRPWPPYPAQIGSGAGGRLQLYPPRHRHAGIAAWQKDHPRDQRHARPAQGLCR